VWRITDFPGIGNSPHTRHSRLPFENFEVALIRIKRFAHHGFLSLRPCSKISAFTGAGLGADAVRHP
jgi:hypothetical protein